MSRPSLSNNGQPRTGIRLSSRDALNIFTENSRIVANLLDVCVFDTSDLPDGSIATDDARKWMAVRIDRSPLFHRRLHRLSGDVGNPYWVDDLEPSMDEHVYVTPMTEPGWSPVETEVARLLNAPMDLSESAWELHLLTGIRDVPDLPTTSCAAVLKVHHSATDGAGLVPVVRDLFGADEPSSELRGNQRKVHIPSWFTEAVRIPLQYGRFAKSLLAAARVTPKTPPAPNDCTATQFNDKARLDQWIRVEWFDVSELKMLKTSVADATVNDIVMTMISLTLDRYLDMDSPTIGARMPLDVHGVRESASANQTAFASVNLHNEVSDPVERLRAVHQSAKNAKARTKETASRVIPRPFESIPPLVSRIAGKISTLSKPGRTVSATTVISNMPHGPADLSLLGHPVVGAFMPMPTVDGMGLIHHVASVGDRLAITITAEKHMMPDPDVYTALLREVHSDMRLARGA